MLVQTVPDDLANFFIQLNKICFFCGVPNLLMYDMKYSKRFVKCFEVCRLVSNIAILTCLISQIMGIFVQQNLSKKQIVNWYHYNIAQTIIFGYIVIFEVYKNRIKSLVYELVVILNGEIVQRDVIKKSKFFSGVLLISMIGLMLSIASEAAILYKAGEVSFTPVITSWPKLNDTSVMANTVRIISVIMTWIILIRTFGMVVIIAFATICLSHQFKNLRRFFDSMNKIFDNDLDAEEKQLKFEQSLKHGIKMHSRTLRCLKQFQDTMTIFFNGQILMNVPVLMLDMGQMVTLERTLINMGPVVGSALSLLIATGFFMCGAGDITLEAAALPTAMYCSGWHRCRGPRISRLRRMLTSAISQAQIIKASYSVLSILY